LLPWSLQNTAELGSDSDDASFLTKAPLIRGGPGEGSNITSVSEAVNKLNSGELVGAETGICICYSRDKQAYFALWKSDAKDTAMAVFNLVEPADGGQPTAQPKTGLAFLNQHATFMNNFRLALTTAMWATFFGVPMYSPLHDTIFGSTAYLSELKDAHGNALVPGDQLACQGSDLFGMVYDSTSSNVTNHMVPWDEDLHGEWVDSGFSNTTYPQVWCGYLPQSYAGNWPNVIQMILFTAYFTTGSTVQLAWQGIMGTFLATANVAVMSVIWKDGALANYDTHGNFVEYKDPNYHPIIGYGNFALVTLLFLLCRAEANTVKFGLSWHAFYMISFVNPHTGPARGTIPISVFGVTLPGQWDSYRTVVLLTSFAGASLAILATLFPYKLLNMAMIKDDGETIVSAIDSIWKDSIEYFCGESKKGKKRQIACRIDSLQGTIDSVNGHLKTAWWECLDFGKAGRQRTLYTVFDQKVGNKATRNLLYAVKGCILSEDFNANHKQFCLKVKAPMDELRAETTGLLHILIGVCREGVCDEKLKKHITWKAGLVKDAQQKLYEAYEQTGDNGPPKCKSDWANEFTFVFALSHWADEMLRFAMDIHDEKKAEAEKKSFMTVARKELALTFSREKMFKPSHLNFVMRNFTSIVLAFIFGALLHDQGFSMFRAYSGTMAGTLGLLMSKVGGSAMEKNLKRLLGVVLGKVIPIVILGNLQFFGCENSQRYLAQGIAVYLFIFAFEYVYFTSANWGSVGILIAGFGCYPLIAFPSEESCHADATAGFLNNYEELCEVTACILLQMVVDVLGEHQSAREKATDHIEHATKHAQECLKTFFDGCEKDKDLVAMDLKKIRDSAMDALAKATEKIPDVDPAKLVAPGPETPFNLSLYTRAISLLQLLVSDLSMIILAIHEPKDHQEEESTASEKTMSKILGDLSSWKNKEDGHGVSFQDDTKNHIDYASKALIAILRKTVETPFKEEEVVKVFNTFEQMQLARPVHGKEHMFKDCDNFVETGERESKKESGKAPDSKITAVKDVFAVRISVIIVACNNIVQHMGELAEICVEMNVH